MLESIKNLYNSIFTKFKDIFVFKKSTIIEKLDIELEEINENVVPNLTDVIKSIDEGVIDAKVIENDKLLKHIRSLLDSDPKTNVNLLNLMLRTCENVNDYAFKINQMVNKNLPATLTDKTVTVKELAILKVLNDIVLFRGYTEDLVYHLLAGVDTDISEFEKSKKRLTDTAIEYSKSIDALSSKNLDKIIKNISEIPSNEVTELIASEGTVAESEVNKIDGMGTGASLIGNGFIGNPIYHIGLWLEDRAHKRNEMRKAKKQTIELILADLRKRSNGEFDAALEKQKKYYENLVTSLEYQIDKYENRK